MEGLFYVVIFLTLFVIILAITGFFITVDFLYFIFCRQRISKIFRIPSEIVAICVTPGIVLCWSSMGDSIKKAITPELLLIVCILSSISYFISTYSHKVFSIYAEVPLFAFIASGCIITLSFLIIQITENNILFALAMCVPQLCLFYIAFVQQYRRYKKARNIITE